MNSRLLTLFSLLAGCAAPAPPAVDWFGPNIAESQAQPCDPQAVPQSLKRTVRLRLFHDDDVSTERFAQATRQAASLWSTWGVRFELAGPAQVIDLDAPLVGSTEAIDRALKRAGVNPEAPAADVDPLVIEGIVSQVVLTPIRTHLQTNAMPAADEVHVVLTPTMAAANSAAVRIFSRIEGVTFLPALAQYPGAEGALGRGLGIEKPYTPTVFVAVDALDSVNPDLVDNTLSHEIGHALGLNHHGDLGNLMALRPPRCLPTLDDAQYKVLRDGMKPLR